MSHCFGLVPICKQIKKINNTFQHEFSILHGSIVDSLLIQIDSGTCLIPQPMILFFANLSCQYIVFIIVQQNYFFGFFFNLCPNIFCCDRPLFLNYFFVIYLWINDLSYSLRCVCLVFTVVVWYKMFFFHKKEQGNKCFL